MKSLIQTGYRLLMSNRIGRYLFIKTANLVFPGTKSYWDKRYQRNGNSGVGSYGEKATYKAAVLNEFVEKHNIKKVIEFGCGDGNQLKQLHFREYIGLDVSPTAIKLCKDIFKDDPSKQFHLYNEETIDDDDPGFKAQLSLSLDVIYHLVVDNGYKKYMVDLFSASSQYVIIYAWDVEEEKKYHVRHRNFSRWIENNIGGFQLKERISKSPFCDFFIYERNVKVV